MASTKESEILTQVGPGTPMGDLMRQYWLPAAMSSELKADGEPLRLVLLGEKLIAFRDTSGRVGVLDHRCPHRCASLFFGRNEHEGLRCVYHGWKFDVAGNCLEMPNLPPEYDYKHKVHAKAYPACERNGLMWVYMGPRAQPPALPLLEPAVMPEHEMRISFTQRECNWVQALEGDIDTTHLSFLHFGALRAEDLMPVGIARFGIANRAAELKVKATPWGTMYGAHRAVENLVYWRFAHFLFPCWTYIPNGELSHHILGRAWVPMDDTHTMVVLLWWKGDLPEKRIRRDGQPIAGAGGAPKYLPNTSDWYGRWRLAANAGNDYEIDRAVQRTRSFTGIDGINLQDQAITESMGSITDHAWEHLGPSDLMIIQTRRRLVQAALALRQHNQIPPGVEDPECYLAARGGDFTTAGEMDWEQAYDLQLRQMVDPTGKIREAQPWPVSEMQAAK